MRILANALLCVVCSLLCSQRVGSCREKKGNCAFFVRDGENTLFSYQICLQHKLAAPHIFGWLLRSEGITVALCWGVCSSCEEGALPN